MFFGVSESPRRYNAYSEHRTNTANRARLDLEAVKPAMTPCIAGPTRRAASTTHGHPVVTRSPTRDGHASNVGFHQDCPVSLPAVQANTSAHVAHDLRQLVRIEMDHGAIHGEVDDVVCDTLFDILSLSPQCGFVMMLDVFETQI